MAPHMREIKKLALRIFFSLEILTFTVFYLFGGNGRQAISALLEQNQDIVHDIKLLTQEVESLQSELNRWNTDMFYKEKIAREHLQMAYPGEELYVIS
jgi:cell division protein FtsB